MKYFLIILTLFGIIYSIHPIKKKETDFPAYYLAGQRMIAKRQCSRGLQVNICIELARMNSFELMAPMKRTLALPRWELFSSISNRPSAEAGHRVVVDRSWLI